MYHKEKNPIFELQKNTKNIRNFCILAHVDHGKVKSFKLIFTLQNKIIPSTKVKQLWPTLYLQVMALFQLECPEKY